jgi:hypothetical protein
VNDPAGLQAAAWLCAHVLVLYAAMLFLPLAATLLGWHLLQGAARQQPQAPEAALSIGARLASGCSLAEPPRILRRLRTLITCGSRP